MGALLDWTKVGCHAHTVNVFIVDSLDQLHDFYAPWYVPKGGGTEVNFDHLQALPVRIVDVPQLMARLLSTRQKALSRLAQGFAIAGATMQFPIPTYSLGGRGTLILDGNHRLAACIVASLPFSLLVFSLRAPINPAVLPDLIHWTGE
jgi:hypothetical protein